jgi:hypothetical protein
MRSAGLAPKACTERLLPKPLAIRHCLIEQLPAGDQIVQRGRMT